MKDECVYPQAFETGTEAQGLVVDRGTKESTRFTRGTLRRLFKGPF